MKVRADGFDFAIADDDGGILQFFGRLDVDGAAAKEVSAGGFGSMPGREEFGGLEGEATANESAQQASGHGAEYGRRGRERQASGRRVTRRKEHRKHRGENRVIKNFKMAIQRERVRSNRVGTRVWGGDTTCVSF